MNDLLKQYGCILIAQNRRLFDVRYPLFCISEGTTYDVDNPLSFKQVIDYLHNNDGATVAILDSFDLGYYGYINSYDLVEYELEHDIVTDFDHRNIEY